MNLSRFQVIALVVLVAGCQSADVVATVGRGELTLADVIWARSSIRGHEGDSLSDSAAAVARREALAQAARRDGLDRQPELRARLAQAEREILAQAWLEKELRSATSDEKVLAAYEKRHDKLVRREVRARHVAIPIAGNSGSDEAAARTRAHEVYSRSLDGTSLELAGDGLDLSGARGEGVLLREGETSPELFNAVALAPKGAVTVPIIAFGAFHVFQVVEARRESPLSFAEARPLLTNELRREAESAALGMVREQFPVVLFEERLQSGVTR